MVGDGEGAIPTTKKDYNRSTFLSFKKLFMCRFRTCNARPYHGVYVSRPPTYKQPALQSSHFSLLSRRWICDVSFSKYHIYPGYNYYDGKCELQNLSIYAVGDMGAEKTADNSRGDEDEK